MRIRASDIVSMSPAKEFRTAMSDNSATIPSTATSERKAEANRRNASKSTGPRTAQGKAWSRLNALKHGVLASQAVLTTVEGRDKRKAFEQLVDGFAHDFAPVGAFEQVLVQQIAACVWRQRRLLMFENRASFRSRDGRTYREMNQRLHGMAPLYVLESEIVEADDVLEQAGLGLDLPSERDTMRLVRYEGSITRSLRNALAQLKAMQQARRAAGGATAKVTPRYEDRAVVVDAKSIKRNRGPEGLRVPTEVALHTHAEELKYEQAERERRQAEAPETRPGRRGAWKSKNYQTKPNMPEDPKAMEKHQRLMETADRVVKAGESLIPRRLPSRD